MKRPCWMGNFDWADDPRDFIHEWPPVRGKYNSTNWYCRKCGCLVELEEEQELLLRDAEYERIHELADLLKSETD